MINQHPTTVGNKGRFDLGDLFVRGSGQARISAFMPEAFVLPRPVEHKFYHT